MNYGARFYDPAIGRFTSIDPLTEQFSWQSGYVYADNDPIGNIDFMGMNAEGADGNEWIPEIVDGSITLIAEEGDDMESLYNFFGGKENAQEFLPESNLPSDFKFKAGDKVKLKEDNVFSKTLSYYNENISRGDDTYDCKELCRQTVLNGTAIENSYTFTGATPSMLKEFGDDWAKKRKITSSELIFGKTFSHWGIFSEHTAVFFGKDNSGEEYFFSKNGARGPLVLESMTELKNTYYLWDWQRTNYAKK